MRVRLVTSGLRGGGAPLCLLPLTTARHDVRVGHFSIGLPSLHVTTIAIVALVSGGHAASRSRTRSTRTGRLEPGSAAGEGWRG